MSQRIASKGIRLFMDLSFVPPEPLLLEEAPFHYLAHVMRFQEGDRLSIFNGRQGEWEASFHLLSKKKAHLLLLGVLRPQETPPPNILLFPVIRPPRLEFMIEKATELGVTDFYPVKTDHSGTKNLTELRLRKISIEAAEQCERLSIPQWHAQRPLEEILNQWEIDHPSLPLKVALERQEEETLLGKDPPPLSCGTALLVGPEGGFSLRERKKLLSKSFVYPLSFGKSILRTETAALAGLARSL